MPSRIAESHSMKIFFAYKMTAKKILKISDFSVCNQFTGWLKVFDKTATFWINSQGFAASTDTIFKFLWHTVLLNGHV